MQTLILIKPDGVRRKMVGQIITGTERGKQQLLSSHG